MCLLPVTNYIWDLEEFSPVISGKTSPSFSQVLLKPPFINYQHLKAKKFIN